MSLTPTQIKERLGSRYPWPLYNKVVPTVFDDCVTWEEQVLWLYRFILGVYLELQDEGYLTIDEVLEDSPAAVKSSGIWKFVMGHVSALNAALDALDGKLTEQMEQLNTDLRKLVADTVEQLTLGMQTLQNKLEADLAALDAKLTGKITELDTRLTEALNSAVARLESELESEVARLEALIKNTKDGLDGEITTINTSITEIRNKISELESALGSLTDRIETVESVLTALRTRVAILENEVANLKKPPRKSFLELHRSTGTINDDIFLLLTYSDAMGARITPYYPVAQTPPNLLADTVTISRVDGGVKIADPGFFIAITGSPYVARAYSGMVTFKYGTSSRDATCITTQCYAFTTKTGDNYSVYLIFPDNIFPDLDNTKYLAVWHPRVNPA